MFKLKRPCVNCPFRRSQAGLYQLHPERLEEIRTASAFQCHKTVDYSDADASPESHGSQGEHPQQCAGLMAVLHAIGEPNQIMQVAGRLTGFDAGKIDATDTFDDWSDVLDAHLAS